MPESTSTDSTSPPSGARFLGIQLSEGVRGRNMLAYLFVALVTSGFFGGMAMLQPAVFNLMGLDRVTQGYYTGVLQITQEVVFIVLAGLFGALSERVGRRAVYTLGLLISAAGYAIYPHASQPSTLIFYRFFFAIGGAALTAMLVTVIADYASDRHRGRANGVQGFIVVIGAFIPFVMSKLPEHFVAAHGMAQAEALSATFMVMGGLGVAAALVAQLGLAGRRPTAASASAEQPALLRIAKEGLTAAKQPGVALSYGAAFISRGDLAVTGAFMMLWGMTHATGQGVDNAKALSMTGDLMAFTIMGALIGSILMGFMADRMRKVTAVSLASGLASIVYIGMFTVDDPFGPNVKFILFFMGIAEISAFVSSQVLCAQQAPPARRGAVTGFFGAAGACGMTLGTGMGSYLFGAVGPAAPFVAFGLLNLAVFVWSLAVRNRVQEPTFTV